MMFRTIISAEQVKAALGQSMPFVMLDTRFDLADPDAAERLYLEGHLPGAHYAHLDRHLSGPKTGSNGRHPLPDFETWRKTVARWRITPWTTVVVYDAQNGIFAARAWWMLRQVGVEAVCVLDGGLHAWLAAGGDLVKEIPPRVDTIWPKAPTPTAWSDIVSADEIERNLQVQCLIDARAPERYRGEVEPLDAAAGHIPGAQNRFFKSNLLEDGRFKSPEQLRHEFTDLLAGTLSSEVIHQCGSGVTACHNLLAMEIAGLPGSQLYPGSWSEWCSTPRRPVAQGEHFMPN